MTNGTPLALASLTMSQGEALQVSSPSVINTTLVALTRLLRERNHLTGCRRQRRRANGLERVDLRGHLEPIQRSDR
jgi:hypothetical protein